MNSINKTSFRNFRIIARLDVKSQDLIKGIQLEGLRKLGSANDFALNYFNQGIDELLIIDAVSTMFSQQTLIQVINEISNNIFIPIGVGGGISNLDEARLIMRRGADKVAINSGSFTKPELLKQISETFGSQSTVASIEVRKIRDEYYCFFDNGRTNSEYILFNHLEKVIRNGAGEILITSIDRDGTMRGMDFELLELLDELKLPVPIIYSGGFGKKEELQLFRHFENVDAVAIASYLHYKKGTIYDLKKTLAEYSITSLEH